MIDTVHVHFMALILQCERPGSVMAGLFEQVRVKSPLLHRRVVGQSHNRFQYDGVVAYSFPLTCKI